MKPPSHVYPRRMTIEVRGRITLRMRLGLVLLRVGAWLCENGGVKVTFGKGEAA